MKERAKFGVGLNKYERVLISMTARKQQCSKFKLNRQQVHVMKGQKNEDKIFKDKTTRIIY